MFGTTSKCVELSMLLVSHPIFSSIGCLIVKFSIWGVSNMKKVADSPVQQQEIVNAHFQSLSMEWKEIYTRSDVQAETIRDRHAAVLDWIDSLALEPASKVLEIGCGAAFMAIALAQRGFRVYAIDSVESMVEQARRNAVESRITDLLSLEIGDVYTLAFEDESFDLVLAIGVIPWLERADLAIQQMARVTRPGGHIILTYANRAGLVSLLDPWTNPALVPLKRRLKEMFERMGRRGKSPTMIFHSNCFIDRILASARLVKIKSMTRGFSFSFRHKVLPEPFGTALHHQLQRLADRNKHGFRSIGMAYFVLARKTIALKRHPET